MERARPHGGGKITFESRKIRSKDRIELGMKLEGRMSMEEAGMKITYQSLVNGSDVVVVYAPRDHGQGKGF